MKKKLLAVFLAAAMLLTTGCGILPSILGGDTNDTPVLQPAAQPTQQPALQTTEEPVQQPTQRPVPVDLSGDAVILFTGDVHCAVNRGFGYAGLQQLRDYLINRGDDVVLVDTGDAIQGEPLGTMSKGEAIISLMNELGYEIAVPGSHEFDYGVDRFLELSDMAKFQYISCNFNKDGQLLLAPYVTRMLGGHLVAFIGVTTPRTLTTIAPRQFMNEDGRFVYSFYQDDYGRYLYSAVQKAVDNARVEGAEYVVVLGHLGGGDENHPWTYSDIISNTNGIDVLLDSQSHDTEQAVVKNKDGKDVLRIASGSRLDNIGYCRIAADGSLSVGVYTWPNEISAPDMMGLNNQMTAAVAAAETQLAGSLDQIFASSRIEMTISDPLATDIAGNPIRMIRSAETNLGDLCADAYRIQSGADVALICSGDISASIPAGDISFGDILRVFPDGNSMCVIEVSGVQIVDALEWAARKAPDELASFMQVSGLSFEIHTYLEETTMTYDNGDYRGCYGLHRVQNIQVNGQPIQYYGVYTLAGNDRLLIDGEDGFGMFRDCKVLQDRVKLDNLVLIDYISENLGGVISDDYENPFGQGRIVFKETP